LKFIDWRISLILRIKYIEALDERSLYEKALKEVDFILSKFPYDCGGYVMQGRIFKEMQKFKEAEIAYKKALQIDPFYWPANRALREIAIQTGKPYNEEDFSMFSQREAKILSLIRMGDYRQAFQMLDNEISASPSSNLYALAGIAFSQVKKCQLAIDAFDEAIRLDAQNPFALYNMAIVYKICGKLDKAEVIMRKFETLKVNQ
jgi:tetratricopeptide (TPR) repeat protein